MVQRSLIPAHPGSRDDRRSDHEFRTSLDYTERTCLKRVRSKLRAAVFIFEQEYKRSSESSSVQSPTLGGRH